MGLMDDSNLIKNTAAFKSIIEETGRGDTQTARHESDNSLAMTGLKLFRGTVVAVNASNHLQIRRSTAVEVDASGNQVIGAPDPAFYPQASPGMLAKVGDEVFGTEVAGKAVITGVIAGAGYRDLPALAAGGLNDYSLANIKYGDNTVNNRVLASLAVQGYNVVGRTLLGSQHLTLRSVLTGEIGIAAVQSGEIMDLALFNQHYSSDSIGNYSIKQRTILTENIGFREVDTGEIAYNAVDNGELAPYAVTNGRIASETIRQANLGDNCVSSSEVADYSLYGYHTQTDAIGSREANEDAISMVGHSHSSTPFVRYTQDARQSMIKTRERNYQLVEHGSTEEIRTLAAANELALKLHMDYYDMNAWEREHRLATDREWAIAYGERYKVGQYWIDDRPDGHLHDDEPGYVRDKVRSRETDLDRWWFDDAYREDMDGMNTREELSNKDQRAHLDNGGIFTLDIEGRFKHVARKSSDGGYIVYSLTYGSSYEDMIQRAIPLGSLASWVHAPNGNMQEAILTAEERPVTLEDYSPRQIRDRLDQGEVFVQNSVNDSGFRMGKTRDGSFIVYNLDRATFDECVSDMAKFGPAWRWVAEHEDAGL